MYENACMVPPASYNHTPWTQVHCEGTSSYARVFAQLMAHSGGSAWTDPVAG